MINLKIHKRRIVAADEDFMNDPYDFSEAVDDLAENVEEVQDTIDDMDEDDPSIEVNNNIEESNQYLKWVVKPAETEGVEENEGTV